jgi:hypothetical protein
VNVYVGVEEVFDDANTLAAYGPSAEAALNVL